MILMWMIYNFMDTQSNSRRSRNEPAKLIVRWNFSFQAFKWSFITRLHAIAVYVFNSSANVSKYLYNSDFSTIGLVQRSRREKQSENEKVSVLEIGFGSTWSCLVREAPGWSLTQLRKGKCVDDVMVVFLGRFMGLWGVYFWLNLGVKWTWKFFNASCTVQCQVHI